MRRVAWFFVAAGLIGCESGANLGAPDRDVPVPFPQGIYDVTVELAADDCTPQNPSGALVSRFVGINVESDAGPTVPMLDPAACWDIVNLRQEDQYQYHTDYTRCYNLDHIDIELTLVSTEEFVVHRVDATTGTFSGCPLPPMVPPTCRLDQTIRYVLQKPCMPGQSVIEMAGGRQDCR